VLTALDHAVLAVRDLDAAARTYARLLGRAPTWRGEHPAFGTVNVLFRLDNTYIELLAPMPGGGLAPESGAWLRERLAAAGEGPVALAFATPDAEAFAREAAARGLRPGPVQKGLGRDVESGAFREWQSVFLPPDATRGVGVVAIEHRSPPELLPPSPALGAPEACVHAVDHVVVQTRDAEAARAFYGEKLGLRLALDREFPQWGARLLFFRIGGLTVEIAATLGGEGGAAAEAAARAAGGFGATAEHDRFWGISWRVGDADAARARLAAAGFDVSDVRTGRRPGTRVFTVRGPTHGVATLMLEAGAGGSRPEVAQ
jgi:catechol 2,3-dioxygenase-like lactoylglutathione lyase family enzyme